MPIPARSRDLSAEFAALAATRPDAIVMAIYPEQAQALMAARARAGWRGRMVSAGPLTDEASLTVPGGSADGTLGFCHYPDPERSQAPGVERYRAASRAPIQAAGSTATRSTAIRSAGWSWRASSAPGETLTRERFIDAMEGLRTGTRAGCCRT